MSRKPKPLTLSDLGLRACLKTREGRAFLWSLLEAAHCFTISADLISPNAPYVTFFREGERNQGNRLLTRIQEADIGAFLTMQREARERANEDDDARERSRAAEFGPSVASDGDGHEQPDASDGNRPEQG